MGETRDEYVHRAKEIGGEQLEKAKQMVTEAGEAVIEQAEREGLTSEGTDQQPHETAEKPLHEPPASRHAMREEPAKQGLPS
jgi:hypothetical protein